MVNIEELIDKVLKVLSYPLKQQEFKVNLEFNIENKMISVDADAIQQMLINLISNSIKFSTRKKFIGIIIYEDENYCIIDIVDRGIGINKKDQKKIFNNYFRSREAISKGVGGVGLGLAIVKDIVKGHNGKINIESETGSGCKFTVYLPKGKTT